MQGGCPWNRIRDRKIHPTPEVSSRTFFTMSHSATQLSKPMTPDPMERLEPLSPTLLLEKRETVNFQGPNFREGEENQITQRKGIRNKY